MALRQEGISKPNPRKHILTDLNELIRRKMLKGYRPVVMMDANGDYRSPKGDPNLFKFIQSVGLVDHYKESIPGMPGGQ